MREPLHHGTRALAAPEAARRERVGHEHRGGAVTRGARPPVGLLRGDARGQISRLIAVEQHVGGQALRNRAGPALEREHRQHDRQKRRHERRAVYPRLYHEGATYAVRQAWGGAPRAASYNSLG